MAVIALDIGGTKIKAAIISNKFKILSSVQVPSLPNRGKSYFLQTLKTLIDSLILGSKHKITSIGISMPGKLNKKGKLIDVGNSLSFLENFALINYLEKHFSLPIRIENDANCFLLAESNLGESKDYSSVLGIIWGSGIGASLAVNGQIQSFPLEFGHNKVSYDDKLVDLEFVSGGRFIEKNYAKLSGNKFSIPQIYKSKDIHAKQVISDAILYLGRELSSLVNVFNPDVIVFGGGVSQLPKPVYLKLLSQIKKHSLKAHSRNLKLLRYSISDDAGLFGAALIAFKK